MAADSIEELLHQDEVDGHNDALRRDLNALTEEQWQYYFKVERKQPDIELGGQLIVRESEERPRVLYIWVAAIAAGFGIAIGAIQASHYLSCRRLCRTIIGTADTSHVPPYVPGDVLAITTCYLTCQMVLEDEFAPVAHFPKRRADLWSVFHAVRLAS